MQKYIYNYILQKPPGNQKGQRRMMRIMQDNTQATISHRSQSLSNQCCNSNGKNANSFQSSVYLIKCTLSYCISTISKIILNPCLRKQYVYILFRKQIKWWHEMSNSSQNQLWNSLQFLLQCPCSNQQNRFLSLCLRRSRMMDSLSLTHLHLHHKVKSLHTGWLS